MSERMRRIQTKVRGATTTSPNRGHRLHRSQNCENLHHHGRLRLLFSCNSGMVEECPAQEGDY
eukprot:1457115-Pleurochrysis_carterae.AAC.1